MVEDRKAAGPDPAFWPGHPRQQPMRLLGLQELGQRLFIRHGHVTLPVMLGLMFLVNGLGHAFFNPTREVAIGALELAAAVLLLAGALLVHVRRTPAALVCYGISVGCVVITVVKMEIKKPLTTDQFQLQQPEGTQLHVIGEPEEPKPATPAPPAKKGKKKK